MSVEIHRAVANARVCALTHPGLVRERNEDYVYAAAAGNLLVCADGLGGLPAGDVASRLAVETIVARLQSAATAESPGIAIDAWRKRLRRAIRAADRGLLKSGIETPEWTGMATTLVVAVVAGDSLCVSHIGDVRAYAWHEGRAEQITADHSVVWEAVERGDLTPEQARVHPSGNIVTQALGLPERLDLKSSVRRLDSGDRVLLCSDGLWETLTHEQMSALLGEGDGAVQCAEGLVAHALDAGGHDNISAVVYIHR